MMKLLTDFLHCSRTSRARNSCRCLHQIRTIRMLLLSFIVITSHRRRTIVHVRSHNTYDIIVYYRWLVSYAAATISTDGGVSISRGPVVASTRGRLKCHRVSRMKSILHAGDVPKLCLYAADGRFVCPETGCRQC